MNVYDLIVEFVNSVLGPPIAFLDTATTRLQSVQLTMAQGLDIGQYFRVFGDLPFAWQMVVVSILASTVLLGTLLTFRSIMRLYYAVKEGVHWW